MPPVSRWPAVHDRTCGGRYSLPAFQGVTPSSLSELNRWQMMLRPLFVFCVLLLTACNWAEPPLPVPNAERDPRLIGDWVAAGGRKLTLSISPHEEKGYRVLVESASARMEFTGYHTDVEGIRIVCLQLHDPRLGEGRTMRWLLLSYEFQADGSFSPLFLSRYVLPEMHSPADYLNISGAQIYASLSGAAKTDSYRALFFDKVEKISFKKRPHQPLETVPGQTP